jgi:hypothetical protein
MSLVFYYRVNVLVSDREGLKTIMGLYMTKIMKTQGEPTVSFHLSLVREPSLHVSGLETAKLIKKAYGFRSEKGENKNEDRGHRIMRSFINCPLPGILLGR